MIINEKTHPYSATAMPTDNIGFETPAFGRDISAKNWS